MRVRLFAFLAVAAAIVVDPAFGLPNDFSTAFTLFESGQVRPLALSPDGTRLFAVNTPDNTLEILNVGAGGVAKVSSVPVGLEPVAVAARSNTEVWVVNHLSDSVSIVDVSATPPRVKRTLLVGDEPSDIVFAGMKEAFPHGVVLGLGPKQRGHNRILIGAMQPIDGADVIRRLAAAGIPETVLTGTQVI